VTESPLRFQLVVATIAIGGALLVADEAPRAPTLLTFQDARIDESSGLVDLGTTLLTVNDSGAGPELYVVDKRTGETVGRTTYTTDEVVDVEALASGPDGSVWVADIGDNGGTRMSVAVYRLPRPAPGERTVAATRYDLAYRGGPKDAETLLVHPRTGRLFVVSKGLFGGEVLAAPARLDPDAVNVLRPVGETRGLVTDGGFLPDGRHVVLRTYSTASVLDARRWNDRASMALPDQPQGEGLAMVASGDRMLLSSEGHRTDVLSVPLDRTMLAAVAEPADPAAADSADAAAAEPGGAAPEEDSDLRVVGLSVAVLVAGAGVVAAGLAGAGLVGAGLVAWRRRRQSRSTT
jgi:hypothetical protein